MLFETQLRPCRLHEQMTEIERLKAYAEGCLYLAAGVSDPVEAERLRGLAAVALAKAEELERQPVHQQQQQPPDDKA